MKGARSDEQRLRHILVHDYFDVEWGKLWEVLQNRIEPLREQIAVVLKEFEAHA